MKNATFAAAALFVLVMASGSPAFAQAKMDDMMGDDFESSLPDEGPSPSVPVDEAPAARPAAAVEQEPAPAEEPVVMLETKKKIKVVQKKLYNKAGRFELTPFFGINPSDALNFYIMEGMYASYFITESIGVQLKGGAAQAFNKKLKDDLIDMEVPEVGDSEIQYFFGGDVVWSPLYGKFSLLGEVIAHYDAFLFAGGGAMKTATGFYPDFDLGLGGRIWLLNWLALRGDFTYQGSIETQNRPDPNSTNNAMVSAKFLRSNYFFTLGVSFLLPAN